MGKVKVVGTGLDQNLNGTYFNNTASETIFSFGSFSVTSNFNGRSFIDYTDTLSSFVRPVTLETMGITEVQSTVIHEYQTNAILNLNKSNLNTFIRFGSAYEFLRNSIQNIILKYPGSLFGDSNTIRGGNKSFYDLSGNTSNNTYTFKLDVAFITNVFGIAYNFGNTTVTVGEETKNLNLSYEKYVVWSKYDPENVYPIIGYTGNTTSRQYIMVQTEGNPFSFNTGSTGYVDFHIKPNNLVFEEFRVMLNGYEQYIMSNRVKNAGFDFMLNNPTLLDDGSITYVNTTMSWATTDGYNIDINNSSYNKFLNSFLTIGTKYDSIKTDLIARFLTPASLKTYDLTQEGKMTKLLRVYGQEFDQLREFIDSLVYINTITYNKINNIPDQLISNFARTLGWNYFTLVNESELVTSVFNTSDTERNLKSDLLPAEVNIELWRRILINANYFWKSKGTREAIKSIFLMIGIPEPFINITEYVYTVDGKIDPRTAALNFPGYTAASLPYNTDGYPKAPLESSAFYFQIAGDSDSGQEYMNIFRKAGFNLTKTVDNKKSWMEAGATTRVHSTTPQYIQADSKLVLNTKEVDVALDTAQGIEYDVYNYIKKDFGANSSGYTMPFTYVNISLGVSASQNTFPLPYNKTEGNLEVRFNGILLNAPSVSGITDTNQANYIINNDNTFTLVGVTAQSNGYRRDVIQATFIYSGSTAKPMSGISVQYVVTRVKAKMNGTYIPLPSYPSGDVQVTINGIALTKGTPQFAADYIVDPANTSGSSQIIISNPDVIGYLNVNPDVQIAYVYVSGSTLINARSEVYRIDSFSTSKFYYDSTANKNIFKLNYKVNNASEVKILIDGIALEPGTDYSVNSQNPYEIFMPKGLHYGSVISAYYLVAQSDYFNPIVANDFGIGDISNLSFLEFIELIQRKLINARTRKTISDFRGGWYPTLLSLYIKYLERGTLPESNPLHSNGYTFENLYPFLSKYNAFFQRFVDELLSATIILNKSGLLIRNTVFTKQKFMYKRGVNVLGNNRTPLNYFGDDGSIFLINEVPVISGETTPGILGSIKTGGRNILGYKNITEYGIEYRIANGYYGGSLPIGLENLGIYETVDIDADGYYSHVWTKIAKIGNLLVDNFNITIPSSGYLEYNTPYEYRMYVKSGIYGFTGDTLQITTASEPILPNSITTTSFTNKTSGGFTTGGKNIVGYGDIDYYSVQYRVNGDTTWLLPSSPSNGPLAVNYFTKTITELLPLTNYEYRAYMVINGVTYTGAILNTTTLAVATYVPTLETSGVTSITISSGSGGGNVTSDGGASVTARGVIWGTSPNPTIALPTKTTDGSGTGSFSSNITGLGDNTTYYVRAYATNSVGTGYGNQVSFTTLVIPPVEVYLTNASYNGVSGGEYDSQWQAQITTSRPLVAGEGFDLHYQTCALSVVSAPEPTLSHYICANAYLIKSPGTTKVNRSYSKVPANTLDSSSLDKIGVIKINSTNYDCYFAYADACSSSGSHSCVYHNCSNVSLSSIDNCCGGIEFNLTLGTISANNDNIEFSGCGGITGGGGLFE